MSPAADRAMLPLADTAKVPLASGRVIVRLAVAAAACKATLKLEPLLKKVALPVLALAVPRDKLLAPVRLKAAKVGEAPLLMFWMVLIRPEPLSVKLVLLKVAIPLVEPS